MLRRHIGVQKCKLTQVSSSQKQWCCVLLLGVEIEAAAIKGIYFARVPTVVRNQGEEAEILSQERRSRWISAIRRADLTDEIMHPRMWKTFCFWTSGQSLG